MTKKELLEWLSLILVVLGLISSCIQAILSVLSQNQAVFVSMAAMVKLIAMRMHV